MKEKNQNEDVQSRREFFKAAAKVLLPTIALISVPQLLSSCEKELWKDAEPTCRDCGGTCKDTCKKACSSNCELTCKDTCETGCTTTCKSTCKSTCYGSCRHYSR